MMVPPCGSWEGSLLIRTFVRRVACLALGAISLQREDAKCAQRVRCGLEPHMAQRRRYKECLTAHEPSPDPTEGPDVGKASVRWQWTLSRRENASGWMHLFAPVSHCAIISLAPTGAADGSHLSVRPRHSLRLGIPARELAFHHTNRAPSCDQCAGYSLT